MIGQQVTFIYVTDLEATHRFYHAVMGFSLALDQGECRIYRVTDTAYVGVCSHRDPSPQGMILTFVTDRVDEWHRRLVEAGAAVDGPPSYSERFDVYQFFAKDPDGYVIEVQSFGAPGTGSGLLSAQHRPQSHES
jgi:predicted enzyme related to lactoylglutathione lyase